MKYHLSQSFALTTMLIFLSKTLSFSTGSIITVHQHRRSITAATAATPSTHVLRSWGDGQSDSNSRIEDSNSWISGTAKPEEDWETVLKRKKDGSFWSDFEPTTTTASSQEDGDQEDASEALIETLSALQGEEIAFNLREAERADTQRQMEEWGFEASTIASALDLAEKEKPADVSLETGMQDYRKAMYLQESSDELKLTDSHMRVSRDPGTGEPNRNQMVYVDEHACIGCKNCAMIAQSTFFMEDENGRARVFEQWGDDETTIQIAMDTCPVDCIHYVPYDELVQLELRRRDQFINVLAGLASRAERGAGSGLMSSTPRSFGSKEFTSAPRISRLDSNSQVAKSEAKKEVERRLKARRRQLEDDRRRANKIADL